MKLSEVHHIAIGVADLDRSLSFYIDVLGLRKTLSMPVGGPDTERALGLAAGTTGRSAYVQGPSRVGQIELIEWDPHLPGTPPEAGRPGPFLLAFELQEGELDEARRRLDAAGHEYEGPIVTEVVNYGPIGLLVTRDPDGTMIELLHLPTDEEIRDFRVRREGG